MPSSSKLDQGVLSFSGGTRAHGEPPALKVCQVRDFLDCLGRFSVESQCKRGRRLCGASSSPAELMCTVPRDSVVRRDCSVLRKRMGNSGWCNRKSCIGADTCPAAKGGCTSPQKAERARCWFHVR